ncbi:MAG TPA: arginase [Pseudomonadota bacterium]|nr:arginase [Pseudomonadota bacterium]
MHKRPHEVEIIGAPLDLGCNLRGANIAPATVRIAGLADKLAELGIRALDSGDLPVPLRETLGEAAAAERYVHIIAEICDELCTRIDRSLSFGRFPLVIGGDHSIAIGTINGAANYFHRQGGELGLIWVDAHADMNTPATSPSGNVHGMPLSTVLGLGHDALTHVGGAGTRLRPENVALIGIRNLDAGEKEFVRQTGIAYHTMTEIDQRGIYAVITDALDDLCRRCSAIHLSFDLDGVDPLWAPGVSTPVPGGLTYREAHLLLEMVAARGILRSMEFVEVNPMYDNNHQTARLTIELALSALGKAIV